MFWASSTWNDDFNEKEQVETNLDKCVSERVILAELTLWTLASPGHVLSPPRLPAEIAKLQMKTLLFEWMYVGLGKLTESGLSNTYNNMLNKVI
jgi:hypothetical protein